MKTNTLIVAVAAGLASVDTTGMLVDPPPRPITNDFRRKLPPTIRGLPENDLQKLPNDFVTKKYGQDTAKKFTDFTGPCGGIPRQPGRSTRVVPGRPSRFAWNVDKSAPDARCKLTLSCPSKSMDRILWNGDCRDAKNYTQDVMIPKDVGPCDEGECYVQWTMETKSYKFCNCADVVVEGPSSSSTATVSSSMTSSMTSSSSSIQSLTSTSPSVTSSSSSKSSSSDAPSTTSSSSSIPSLTSKILIPSASSSISLSSQSSSSSVKMSSSTSSMQSTSTSSLNSSAKLITPTASVPIVSASSSSSLETSSSSAPVSTAKTSFSEKIGPIDSSTSTSSDVTVTCTSSMDTLTSSESPISTCTTCNQIPTSTCSTCTFVATSSSSSPPQFTTVTTSSYPVTTSGLSSIPQLTTISTSPGPSSISQQTLVSTSSLGSSSVSTISTSIPQLTTISTSAAPSSIPQQIVTEKVSMPTPPIQTQTVTMVSTGQCPMPSVSISTVNMPVTITEATTAISHYTSTERATITATVTEAVSTTLTSIGTEMITTTVTSAKTEKMMSTETLVNLQTVFATSTVTEKAASLVPKTLVSTMIMTEKMLPVTVTATQPGQLTTLTERIPETVFRTEKAISIATTTKTFLSNVSASCAPSIVISSVPTTVLSVITENRPVTLTQKNFMTVTVGQTILSTATYVSTQLVPTTVANSLACPLQEKTITRIITSAPISISPSSSTCTTCKPIQTATYQAPMTSKMNIPTLSTSSKMSGGSICPTPTLSDKTSLISSAPSVTSLSSSGSCQEGQKRCDLYDRRQYNECKGGQWSVGIKMTEADNLQCQESGGSVQIVPIPAKNFHV